LTPNRKFSSYCKLTNSKLTVKTNEYFQEYEYDFMKNLLKHISPFKRVFVTNKPLRADSFK